MVYTARKSLAKDREERKKGVKLGGVVRLIVRRRVSSGCFLFGWLHLSACHKSEPMVCSSVEVELKSLAAKTESRYT